MKCCLILVLAAISCQAFLAAGVEVKKSPVTVDVYYESLCGDSMNFIKRQLTPSYPKLKDYVKVNFIPYGKATHTKDQETGPWVFSCQHGSEECHGNKAQACAINEIQSLENPVDQQRLAVELVGCAMSSRYPPTAIPQCAQTVGLNQEAQKRITQCLDGPQGDDLLAKYGDRTRELQPQISFVPTVVINGEYSRENQNAALRNFFSLICKNLPQDGRPSDCPAN
ncbi:GILT-like protein 1 [Prorops nasuta]|uniref:GILT-like protein 1 n=1 Tax=Prorops nasuta TaxID=863751 RepID=UPI0034CE1B76